MNKLLNVKDLQETLKISRSKAYSLFNDKTFPTINIGKCKRVFENELLNWLKNNKNML